MASQEEVPLFSKMEEHVRQNPLSFHVPGHKNGILSELKWQDMLKYDLTEISGLDDLHHPEGAIREAEALLSSAYGASKSFFLVGGSTSGNLAMILAAVRRGERVLVTRDAHKSVVHALELAGARPVFLNTKKDVLTGVSNGVDVATLEQAFREYPDIVAAVLTYPSYYGTTFDLARVAQVIHHFGALVLVDEAHGAHFAASDAFPRDALRCGADAVVQSAHKTLPAMTMGAFLHINSDSARLARIRHYLQIVQTSSPSYLVMASLDLARRFMAMYSDDDFQAFWKMRAKWVDYLEDAGFTVLLPDDPLKLVVRKNGYSGHEIARHFEAHDYYPELADDRQMLLILPLTRSGTQFAPTRELRAIKAPKGETRPIEFATPKLSELALSYTEMAELDSVLVALDEAVHAVAAENISVYPPGIPFVLRGEKLTEAHIAFLKATSGVHFHGGEHLKDGKIAVYL
ncbi:MULTISPECIES: aminotransferase class I/II-fold pyridoxal phosphate-dependent enzyme [Listeria]|uniref:aminotransferase class I/II-fold pyridoxal phosphate-dependent enzyme n=1 Tax=Listeria TaxID=1637 RepID=UPI000B592ECA|nr:MULTISPECIES: aminotransferase class I/II-fold pyridoxal phosphate-dependent enzyme [Listeria]